MDQKKLENLNKLKELLDSGVLTQEEFDKQKQTILNAPKMEVKTKSKLNKKSLVGFVIAVLIVVIGIGVGIYSSNSSTSEFDTKERVVGAKLNDRYDETLAMLKQDQENIQRGLMTDPDQSTISVFQKEYRGVTFDYVYLNFTVESLSSIELRKVANGSDSNPDKLIKDAYNKVIQNLTSDYPSYSENEDGMTFYGSNEKIRVSHSSDSFSQEWVLTITIEHT